jgi:hypothetical protein
MGQHNDLLSDAVTALLPAIQWEYACVFAIEAGGLVL